MSDAHIHRVNLNLLVTLDALLETCSVTEASRRLHVTPSAVSHALRQLRATLGDPLLVRTSGGLERSPRAERIAGPLRRALTDLGRAVHDAEAFDPATTARSFVIAAPDFVSTVLISALMGALRGKAPAIDVEVRPTERRANAARLESGEVDLAVGAVIETIPGIRRMRLYRERFACALRQGHPALAAWDLDAYCAWPHVQITLSDATARRPGWVEEALARQGRTRQVVVRVRSFLSAPLVVAASDAVITGPETLLRYVAARFPLDVVPCPVELPTYAEEALWHERFDLDPGHRWLREQVRSAAAEGASGRGFDVG